MGKTRIAWATDTWNPITGCSHAGSPGCDHCYARRMAKRLAGRYGYPETPHEFDVTYHHDKVGDPLRWRKPRVVFVSSMGDLFHEDVDYQWLDTIFAAMAIASRNTFLVLTKRPAEMRSYLEAYRGGTRYTADRIDEATADEFDYWDQEDSFVDPWPLRNVWLGVTVETEEQMWRVEELLKMPTAKRFVSIEPCLGLVDLTGYLGQLDGVIVGGESGAGARPMNPDWARSIRDQCLAPGVPFTMKQWGEWLPACQLDGRIKKDFEGMPEWVGTLAGLNVEMSQRRHGWPDGSRSYWFGKKAAGRELDGKVWDEFPWNLIKEG